MTRSTTRRCSARARRASIGVALATLTLVAPADGRRAATTRAPTPATAPPATTGPLTVSVMRGGALTEVRYEGAQAQLRSTTSDAVRTFTVEPERVEAMRVAARHAMADRSARTKCLDGPETAVVITLGGETRTAALCEDLPRHQDERWMAVVALVRASLPRAP